MRGVIVLLGVLLVASSSHASVEYKDDIGKSAWISNPVERQVCYSDDDSFVRELDDDSFLNRVANAFGLPKEYPCVKSRRSPQDETALSKEQIADKERLIQRYLTLMRTGFFEEARECEVQLQQYRDYLSSQDFEEVAERIYVDQPESKEHLEFVFFPSFYRKVYSAVVRTLGDQHEHFEWPWVFIILSRAARIFTSS